MVLREKDAPPTPVPAWRKEQQAKAAAARNKQLPATPRD
jgi:hypothetical protein